MKKIFLLGLIGLLMCGCARENESEVVTPEVIVPEISALEITTQSQEFTKDKLKDLIDENIYCNLYVFKLNYLPRESNPVEYNGRTLYQVDTDVFADFAAFEEYIYSVYCDETANMYLDVPGGSGKARYVNIDGKLFVDINGEGGKGYFVDWSDYSIEIKDQTDGKCEFTVTAKVEWPAEVLTTEDYPVDGVAIFEDGEWVLEKMIY